MLAGGVARARSEKTGHQNGLNDALFVLPLFFIYQFGIVTSRVRNGVDVLTQLLVDLSLHDFTHYIFLLIGLLVIYLGLIIYLRRHGRFHPSQFFGLLGESIIYALLMGLLIVFVMNKIASWVPSLRIPGTAVTAWHLPSFHLPHLRQPVPTGENIVAMAAGAGFHEELIFRLGGVAGLAWLLRRFWPSWAATLSAIVISSLVFSAAHHIGAAGEPFTANAFVYRSLAGVYFASIFCWRGFAVAAWTHALYDLFFLAFVAPAKLTLIAGAAYCFL